MEINKLKISSFAPFILILILVTKTDAFAQTQDDYQVIKQANKAYTEGKFEEAAQLYEKVIGAGFAAAKLYYNLGNTYYRLGDYKSAILNYERAKLLKPDDEDILTNLEYSQRFVQDKIETVPRFFLIEWGITFIDMFSEKAWAIISIITFILFLTGTVAFLFTKVISIRRLSFYIGILAIFVSLISYYCSYKQNQKLTRHNTAIVFSPSVTVKSSPKENGTDLFIIHEGLKVTITGKSPGWKEIRLSDGKVGWLPDESIVEI